MGVSAAATLEEREELCRDRGWGCQREDSREGCQADMKPLHPYLHCADFSQKVLLNFIVLLAVTSGGFCTVGAGSQLGIFSSYNPGQTTFLLGEVFCRTHVLHRILLTGGGGNCSLSVLNPSPGATCKGSHRGRPFLRSSVRGMLSSMATADFISSKPAHHSFASMFARRAASTQATLTELTCTTVLG